MWIVRLHRFFAGEGMGRSREFSICHDAMLRGGSIPFGGYFLEAYLINGMRVKMFMMDSDMPLTQQFAGYALVVLFLLQIIIGILPDFNIIGLLLQFYIVYVVWEGASTLMEVEEKDRLRFTIISSILLIACPMLIQFIFNKLTMVLN